MLPDPRELVLIDDLACLRQSEPVLGGFNHGSGEFTAADARVDLGGELFRPADGLFDLRAGYLMGAIKRGRVDSEQSGMAPFAV
ncbi:hypothetical protein [Nonomuraea sp. SYSU D8015]|uniref:hypothetical protein n=1 Tax=Nonomuraea sp. SYSU D8015 TaxID=2593644 RepID=UPI0016616881|nr:hypothetical protein [Nonomuraea sp. SYSU D8015]